MYIKRICAKHLIPCYSDVDLEFGSINLLLGPNSSGKTKFLETLHAFLNHSFHRTNESRSQYEHLTKPLLERNTRDQIFIEMNRENIPVEWYTNPDNIPERIRLKDRLFKNEADIEYKYITAGKSISSRIDTREAENQIVRRSEKNNTSDVMADLVRNRKLVAQIQFEIENLFGIKISKQEIGYNISLNAENRYGNTVFLDDEGRGIRFYVILFFYLYHPKFKILLIDEPENSLHPQLQKIFISRVRELATSRKKQVFLASHSPSMAMPNCVEDLKTYYVFRPFEDTPRIIQMCDTLPETPNEMKKFESYLPNLDSFLSELFFASGIMIVEGPTDRLFLRHIASTTMGYPSHYGVSIVESNGLSLMPGLITIIKNLFSDWLAISDRDFLINKGYPRFKQARRDFERVLGLEEGSLEGEIEESVKLLNENNVEVITKYCLEEYYQSPESKEYELQKVPGADKGWLLEREIDHINALAPEQVRENYDELYTILRNYYKKVTDKHPRMKANIEDYFVDLLDSDGQEIFKIILAEKPSPEQLGENEQLRTLLEGYKLEFENHENYNLYLMDLPYLRIRVTQRNFQLERLSEEGIAIKRLIQVDRNEVDL